MTTTAPHPNAERIARLEELEATLSPELAARYSEHWPDAALEYEHLDGKQLAGLEEVMNELAAVEPTGFYDPAYTIPLEGALSILGDRIRTLREVHPGGFQWFMDTLAAAGVSLAPDAPLAIDIEDPAGLTWELYDYVSATIAQVEAVLGSDHEGLVETLRRRQGLDMMSRGQLDRMLRKYGVPETEGFWTTGHLAICRRLLDVVKSGTVPVAVTAPPPEIPAVLETVGAVVEVPDEADERPDISEVPVGQIKTILEWVGTDKARAHLAAVAESIRKGEKARKGIVEGVAKVLELPDPVAEEVQEWPAPAGEEDSSHVHTPAGERFNKRKAGTGEPAGGWADASPDPIPLVQEPATPTAGGDLPAIGADEVLVIICRAESVRFAVLSEAQLAEVLK